MEIQLRVIGVLLVLLALVHIVFPGYFNWKEELKPLSLINRQMMGVHTFFVSVFVFLMGLLCLSSAEDLVRTELGKTLALGMGLFWLLRLYFQFFVYSPELWKGKKFETAVHVVFSFLWVYLSSVFLWIGVY